VFVTSVLAIAAGCASKPAASYHAAPVAEAEVTAEASPAVAHCAHHAPPPATAPLPGRSLHHWTGRLTDQRGTELDLGELRGHPVLVAMFYASCTSVCPMLIAQLQQVDRALPQHAQAATRVLLVSLDPERDTPERLAKLAKRHGVDDPRWYFARTSEAGVQELAALLGVSFRRLPGGEISHSPLIALLDSEGVVVARREGALGEPAALASTVAALLHPRPEP
jgi:protein SCO1/2